MAAANPGPTTLDYALQLAAGTAAALAMSFGGDPAAANRTGLYGDLTASAEKIVFIAGAQAGPYFQRNASTVDAYFPGAVTITGNLTVNGSTTTINSTTLEVDDRVIRVNKTTGANDPVPSAITGISVYRGAIASVARDAYGLFWDESATKWKLAVNTGADDATIGAYLSLQALAITGTTITASTAFVGGTFSGTTASFTTLASDTHTLSDAANIVIGSSTGTKLGTATSQKLGFFNATPIVQPSGDVATALQALGLVASPTIAASDVTLTTNQIGYGVSGLLGSSAGFAIVGTPSATAPSTGTLGPGLVTGLVHMAGNGLSSIFTTVAFGNGVAKSTGILGYACQGTAASPGATITADNCGLYLRGHDGTNFTTSQGQVIVKANGTWTPSSQPTVCVISTTPTSSVTLTPALTMDTTSAAFTGAVLGPVGSISAPTFAFSGDATTGFYRGAAGVIGLVSSGTERMRYASTGGQLINLNASTINVAPITVIQAMTLHGLDATQATYCVATYGAGGGFYSRRANGTAAAQTALALDDHIFDLFIQGYEGTTPGYGSQRPAYRIHAATAWTSTDQSFYHDWYTAAPAATGLTFRMRLMATGNLGIGTATDGMTASGSLAIAQDLAHRGTKVGFFNATPVVVPTSTTDLRTALINLGLYTTGGASPLNLNGGALTAAAITGSGLLTTNDTTEASAIGTASVVHVGGVSIAKKTYHGDDLVFSSGADFVFDGAGSGSKLGTATSQKIGLWNATPVVQYSTTGTVTGFTAATTTPVLDGSTFTGNTGSTAYTIGDIVRALKLCGVMAA